MSTFPSELDSFLAHSEQYVDTTSEQGSYEQQVQAQVEQLGPAPSLTQALTLILTQSAKAEHESRHARQQLAHNLKKAVQVVKTNHSDIETMKGSVATVEGSVGDIKDGQVYLEQKAGQMEYLVNKTYSITCENRQRSSKGNFILRGKDIPRAWNGEDLEYIVRDLLYRKYGIDIQSVEFQSMHCLPGDGILFVLHNRMPGWSYEQLVRRMNFNPKPEVEVYCCIQLFEPYSEMYFIARRLKFYKMSSYYRLDQNGFSYIALNEQSKAFKFTSLDQLTQFGLQIPVQIYNELFERRRRMTENEVQNAQLNLRKAQEPRPNIPPRSTPDPNQTPCPKTPSSNQAPNTRTAAPDPRPPATDQNLHQARPQTFQQPPPSFLGPQTSMRPQSTPLVANTRHPYPNTGHVRVPPPGHVAPSPTYQPPPNTHRQPSPPYQPSAQQQFRFSAAPARGPAQKRVRSASTSPTFSAGNSSASFLAGTGGGFRPPLSEAPKQSVRQLNQTYTQRLRNNFNYEPTGNQSYLQLNAH